MRNNYLFILQMIRTVTILVNLGQRNIEKSILKEIKRTVQYT